MREYWQEQLAAVADQFRTAAHCGYFVRFALASFPAKTEVERRFSSDHTSWWQDPIPSGPAEESLAARRKWLRDLAEEHRRDAEAEMWGGSSHPLLTRKRNDVTCWNGIKEFDFGGVWGDTIGVQRFAMLAKNAGNIIPYDLDPPKPLFPLVGVGDQAAPDPVSRWLQLLYTMNYNSFTRIVFDPRHCYREKDRGPRGIAGSSESTPSNERSAGSPARGTRQTFLVTAKAPRVVIVNDDPFRVALTTITILTKNRSRDVQRIYAERLRDVQAIFRGAEQSCRVSGGSRPRRGRRPDDRDWRKVAEDLYHEFERPGGRIDYERFLAQVKRECEAERIPTSDLNPETIRGRVHAIRERLRYSQK